MKLTTQCDQIKGEEEEEVKDNRKEGEMKVERRRKWEEEEEITNEGRDEMKERGTREQLGVERREQG